MRWTIIAIVAIVAILGFSAFATKLAYDQYDGFYSPIFVPDQDTVYFI